MRQFITSFFTFILFQTFGQAPDFQWIKTWGGIDYDEATAVAVNSNNEVYVAGSFTETVDFDPGTGQTIVSAGPQGSYYRHVFLSKFDVQGNFLWVKEIEGPGNSQCTDIKIDHVGNILIAGHFTNTADFDPDSGTQSASSNGSDDIFLIKLNPDGEFLWSKQFGSVNYDASGLLYLDAQNAVFLMGYFMGAVDFDSGSNEFLLNSGSTGAGFLLKLDENGDFQWAKEFDGYNTANSRSVYHDPAGNIYATGWFIGVDFDPGTNGTQLMNSAGERDFFLTKYDASGNFIWTKQFGGTGNDVSINVLADANQGIYIIGFFNSETDFDPGTGTATLTSTNASEDLFILKLDQNGDFQWVKQIGGDQADQPRTAVWDDNNNICIAGFFSGQVDFDPGIDTHIFNSSQNSSDAYLLNLDASGNFVWASQITSAETVNPFYLYPASNGTFYCSGYFKGTADFDPGTNTANQTPVGYCDAFFLKLAPCSTQFSTDTQTSCGAFEWIDGNTYFVSNNSATHTIVGGAANGCDSIVTLNLTINQPAEGTDVQSACGSFDWIDGNTYFASNNSATYTISGGAANGCDSIVTLNLIINQPAVGTDVQSACGSFDWIDGNTYFSSNNSATHTIVGGAANGCDSVVTLNLTINQPAAGTDVQSACGSFDWIDGNTYFSSNNSATYTISGGAANGCDSIVTLHLTINQPTAGTDVQSACGSFDWIDGNTYFTSNNSATHTIVGGAANGCDSIVTLNLTITNLDLSVSESAGILTANQSGATYQWLDCDNGNTPIADATEQSFTPSVNGNYAVELFLGNCTDVSACVEISGIGIAENAAGMIRVYPNPFNDVLHIDPMDKSISGAKLFALDGTLVEVTFTDESTLSTASLPDGMYLLQIVYENGFTYVPVVKN